LSWTFISMSSYSSCFCRRRFASFHYINKEIPWEAFSIFTSFSILARPSFFVYLHSSLLFLCLTYTDSVLAFFSKDVMQKSLFGCPYFLYHLFFGYFLQLFLHLLLISFINLLLLWDIFLGCGDDLLAF
jgi:hypothetical protein